MCFSNPSEYLSNYFQKLYRQTDRQRFVSYRVSINAANVADVSLVVVLGLLLVSQLSEGVDDNTEQDVDHDDDNQDVEGAVECELHEVPIENISLKSTPYISVLS